MIGKYPEIRPHGLCVGCSIQCHEGHDLIELGSRIAFKCDCGNGRLPSACQLNPDK